MSIVNRSFEFAAALSAALLALSVQAQTSANPAQAPQDARPAVSASPAMPEPLRIAFLRPPASDDMSAPAEIVRKGVLAGCSVGGEPCEITDIEYTVQTSDVALQQAALSGANVVIGPLGRDNVSALSSVPIPTVALGDFNSASTPGPLAVSLNLNPEKEARQIARYALSMQAEGPRSYLIVAGERPHEKRIAAALEKELLAAGAQPDLMAVSLEDIYRSPAHMDARHHTDCFLVLGPTESALVRTRLERDSRIYGTSLSNPGSSRADPALHGLVTDLSGVTMVDSPWLLSAGQGFPFPMPEPPLSVYNQRLYALGIDATQVARHWASLEQKFSVHGATGTLTYDVMLSPAVDRQAAIFMIGQAQSLVTTEELADKAGAVPAKSAQ